MKKNSVNQARTHSQPSVSACLVLKGVDDDQELTVVTVMPTLQINWH